MTSHRTRPATSRRAFSAWLLLPALALGGCASGPPASPADAAPSPTPRLDPGIHWVRTAAEHRILFETVFEAAGEAVRTAAVETQGPWGVIIDADETLLDNSTYQLRRAELGLGFTPESWNDWVREEAATALPGARGFAELVRELGGRVAVVTNRDEEVCEETRRNLSAVGIHWDVVLCRAPGPSEKESRFASVQDGTASAALPPLTVLAWVGDNIHDFPGGHQGLRDLPSSELREFGTRFFVLPNPMYGSWESNPPN